MTGGYQNWGLGYLDSTELLTLGDTAWRTADPLPAKLNGLKAVTVDNVPFVLGLVSSIQHPAIVNLLTYNLRR